ncbi:MAG TPA: HD-GYP domain-containing protein [Solirubrobacterales bacterium]|nr:HD-GYP domain-containing protein [Solirubrobacterales bacterium]
MGDRVNVTESVPPGIQRLLAQSRGRMPRAVGVRERNIELAVGGAFVAAAVLIALLVQTDRTLDWPAAIIATVSLAVASLVVFEVGSVHSMPTQVAFVPMLFALPPELVPAFVFAALLAGKVVTAVASGLSPGRVLMAAGDSWYAVGPALVLAAAGAPAATEAGILVLAAALAAQFAVESLASGVRERLHGDASLSEQFAESRWIYVVDTLLAPVGFAVALAATGRTWALLLPLPLFLLLLIFARERSARLQSLLELSSAYRGTAHVLGDMVEHDDSYTGTHSRSVVELAVSVAAEIGIDDRRRRNVEFGALLHDVGKVAIPKALINKPGPLDEREWMAVRTHTVEGQRMLEKIGGLMSEIGTVVRSSHERYDGGGYPDGLAAEEIPIESRIIFACDAFSAMTTDRPYRSAIPIEAAITELEDNAGTQFDPEVVTVLVGQVRDRYGIPALALIER